MSDSNIPKIAVTDRLTDPKCEENLRYYKFEKGKLAY